MPNTRQDNSQESMARAAAMAPFKGITDVSARAGRKMSAVQRTPVGKRVFNVIRNLAWVVPLTLLIWIYAEREERQPYDNIAVPLSVRADRPDRIALLTGPSDGTLYLTLEGTRHRVEKARDELKEQRGINISVGSQLSTGVQVVPTIDYVRDVAAFAENGIVVKSVTPSALTLQIDDVKEIEVRPQVSRELAARLDGVAEFEPAVVRVRGPKLLLDAAARGPIVTAEVSEQMLPSAGGVQEIASVPLRVREAGEQVSISPASVRAKIKLRSGSIRYTISTVPVFICIPKPLMDKYDVTFPNGPFMPRVTVVGPEDQIQRIKSGEFVPKAILDVRPEDARERPLPRPPAYTLPENVRPAQEDADRTIAFELVSRVRSE